jgi:hypothetical protein
MAIQDTLNDLSARAEGLVTGIPWAQLEAQGKAGNYVADYMAPAFERAYAVMKTLYYDPVLFNKSQTESAVKQVAENIYDGVKDQIELVLTANVYALLKSGVTVSVRSLRDVISLAYGTAVFGAKLHATTDEPNARTVLPLEDVKAHADRIVRIFEAIKILDDLGVLVFMKWDSSFMEELRVEEGLPPNTPNPMKGLGVVPIVAIAIAIVAGIVLIAGIWIWASYASEYNRKALEAVKQICLDPNQPESVKKQCVETLGTPQAGFAAVAMKLGTTALTYIFIGALIVGGIYFAPMIVRSFREAKAEARA